ncbi:hypothetical protein CHGG_07926 [Chaetomium globosum CBS 148.51]|uniref:Uncharacterized protein n=1 Tax=Chaetomium globosum (strain ATCC 6205 / CBS 148.51 / DSM 1962 / NBRC 6347 / NRRL 1970) TaxID=306901 RepID=Q2GVS8_CHAGB|nr:uncharacterized protein CHGG_07926 [Chaetomium globosum CBS 148.51]EAQ86673.1 hypothetical protein CHGG_07926 [Chaetomium globosum CBS 148.51]
MGNSSSRITAQDQSVPSDINPPPLPSVLKEIHAEMGGIENVEKLMGETEEAIAYQREVSEIIAGRISVQDEEEVEDELAALEAEVSKKERPQRLPNVPDTQLPAQNNVGEEAQAEQAGRNAQTERQAMLA